MLNPRKLTDLPHFAIIKGAAGCGKKSLIFSLFDDFTFIDMADLRYEEQNLAKLVEKEKIKTLVINEPQAKLEPLANLERMYILSQMNDYEYLDFVSLRLNFLDYEEFISFSKKTSNENFLLSNYLLQGQNPMNTDQDSEKVCQNLQKLLKENLNQNELLAMREIALKIGVQTSVLALFDSFKNSKKIAKNDFFRLIKTLENRFLIHWVKHIYKNNKKPYFTDFALKNALSFKKDFSKTYENLVANELLLIYDEIFYHDEIDFIIESAELCVLCEPFTNKDFSRLKSKKISKIIKKLKLKTAIILSLNEQFSYIYEGIKYIGLPLNIWLLSKDLNDWD